MKKSHNHWFRRYTIIRISSTHPSNHTYTKAWSMWTGHTEDRPDCWQPSNLWLHLQHDIWYPTETWCKLKQSFRMHLWTLSDDKMIEPICGPVLWTCEHHQYATGLVTWPTRGHQETMQTKGKPQDTSASTKWQQDDRTNAWPCLVNIWTSLVCD